MGRIHGSETVESPPFSAPLSVTSTPEWSIAKGQLSSRQSNPQQRQRGSTHGSNIDCTPESASQNPRKVLTFDGSSVKTQLSPLDGMRQSWSAKRHSWSKRFSCKPCFFFGVIVALLLYLTLRTQSPVLDVVEHSSTGEAEGLVDPSKVEHQLNTETLKRFSYPRNDIRLNDKGVKVENEAFFREKQERERKEHGLSKAISNSSGQEIHSKIDRGNVIEDVEKFKTYQRPEEKTDGEVGDEDDVEAEAEAESETETEEAGTEEITVIQRQTGNSEKKDEKGVETTILESVNVDNGREQQEDEGEAVIEGLPTNPVIKQEDTFDNRTEVKIDSGKGVQSETDEIEEGGDSKVFSEFFTCDRSHWRTDVCSVKGDVRFSPENRIAVLYARQEKTVRGMEKVRPYPFKWGTSVMDTIEEITLISANSPGSNNHIESSQVDFENKASLQSHRLLDLEKQKPVDFEAGKKEKRNRIKSESVPLQGGMRFLLEDLKNRGNRDPGEKRLRIVRRNSVATVEEVKRKFKAQQGIRLPRHLSHWGLIWGERREIAAAKKAAAKAKRGRRKDRGVNNVDEGVEVKQEAKLENLRKWGNSSIGDTAGEIPDLECDIRHNVTGVVFSVAGYTGNTYHEWHNGILPLWITIQHLRGEVTLVVVQPVDWWFMKYRHVIRALSKYPIVLVDSDPYVHCFPELIVGLYIHDEVTVDPKMMPHGETVWDFQRTMKKALDKKVGIHNPQPEGRFTGCRPVMTYMVRESNRVITNEANLLKIAVELGFVVRKSRPIHETLLEDIWHEMQATDLLFGVHGAALTHFLFMRPGAAYIQVVPLGIDYISHSFLGAPAERLGLQYMEYKIDVNESSLSKIYPQDNEILKNPQAMLDKGESALYLLHQNVTLNEERMRQLLFKTKLKLRNAHYFIRQSNRAARNPACREVDNKGAIIEIEREAQTPVKGE